MQAWAKPDATATRQVYTMPGSRFGALMLAASCTTGAGTAHAHVESALPSTAMPWAMVPWTLVPLMLSAVVYAAGHRRLARRSRSGISRLRLAAFAGSHGVLLIALASPLDTLGGQLFSAHMLQHELLMLVAAPLLIWSRPLGLYAWGLPAGWRPQLVRLLNHSLLRGCWRWFTGPLVAWNLHALALWTWHVPILFQAGLRNDAVHTVQHMSFLVSALLFWWALARRDGQLDPVLYVFTTLLHTGILGMLLTFSPNLWYPAYVATAPQWGLSPLEDQQLGGLVMWVPAGAILTGIALCMFGRWLKRLSRSPAATNAR